MMDRTSSDSKTPVATAWLGGLGGLPFVALALATHLAGEPWRGLGVHALAAYGATILSFLGGVHWGLAIASHRQDPQLKLAGWLVLSVIPSLLGWAALLLPMQAGLTVQATSFAMMLVVDLRATRIGRAPAWYPTLRIPLTCVVVASLILGAFA